MCVVALLVVLSLSFGLLWCTYPAWCGGLLLQEYFSERFVIAARMHRWPGSKIPNVKFQISELIILGFGNN